MNSTTVKRIAASLALVTVLSACGASKPAATATTGDATAAPVASAPATASTAEAEAPTQIPATAAAIWQAIDQQSAALKAAIQNNALKDVHHQAFAIRDLVAALPDRSRSLPADAQANLQRDVKFVATLADRLDATGDANDQAGAQSNYDKLATVLSGIARAQ